MRVEGENQNGKARGEECVRRRVRLRVGGCLDSSD